MGEHRYEHYGRMFSASGMWGVLCAVAGGCAALTGAAVLFRALAPQIAPWLAAIDDTSVYVAAAVCSAVTAVFVVIARVRARNRNRHTRSTRWGVLAIVITLVLTGLAAAVGTMFPDGLIAAPIRDEAPIGDQTAMEQGIDATSADGCADGWQSISSTGYPGVTAIRMCASSRVAYATFDNDAALPLYRMPLEAQATSMLDERAGELADAEWATLSGPKWIVVGEQDRLEALQRSWGGELAGLGADDETGTQ